MLWWCVCVDGLGNIRDERLFQTWKKDKKVKWLRPEQSAEEWFNMFVLHQNRIGALFCRRLHRSHADLLRVTALR